MKYIWSLPFQIVYYVPLPVAGLPFFTKTAMAAFKKKSALKPDMELSLRLTPLRVHTINSLKQHHAQSYFSTASVKITPKSTQNN